MYRVAFNEDVEPSALDGLISYEQLNDNSDDSNNTDNSISARNTFAMADEPSVSLELIPNEIQPNEVQEGTA